MPYCLAGSDILPENPDRAGPSQSDRDPRHAGAVRLSQGDIIEIGELQFKTHLAMTDEPYRDPMAVAPQDIVSAGSNPLDNLMDTRAAQDDAPLQGMIPHRPSVVHAPVTRCRHWKMKA